MLSISQQQRVRARVESDGICPGLIDPRVEAEPRVALVGGHSPCCEVVCVRHPLQSSVFEVHGMVVHSWRITPLVALVLQPATTSKGMTQYHIAFLQKIPQT